MALSKAIGDEKLAKQIQAAAKKESDPSKKRAASDVPPSPDVKRKKTAYELTDEPQTPEALEASLALPEPSTDEEHISKIILYTNRAPLVLVFAVTLLKYTMPEQPLSSRLSLAQAVVSVNSRSKAVSLGIASGPSAEQDGWGHGQPKVRIMGREIHVLKRGGYEWNPAQENELNDKNATIKSEVEDEPLGQESSQDVHDSSATGQDLSAMRNSSQWAVSQSISSKQSTFVARAIGVKSSAQAINLFQKLLASNQKLREATHNVTAWRVQNEKGSIIEECNDDGETGGGCHVLGILQSSNLIGVLVVLTRWYGGVLLGSQRWELMSQVCRDALSQRLRVTGAIGQEPLWGLDLETMKSTNAPVTGGAAGGMPIHRPESARAYILKAFASKPDSDAKKKKSAVALEREKEHNLGLLLGALEMLFASWVDHISRDDLDRRAWSWYVQVRPDVESGVAGWGSKGEIKLANILDLRRKS